MKRTIHHATLVGALLASACTPQTQEPKVAQRTVAPPEPEPTSTAWLYVTGDVRGGRVKECAAVLEAVRAETACQRGLCKYAEELGSDWLGVCSKRAPDAKAEVESLVAGYAKVSEATELKCEVEARGLIRQGCPSDDTCAETAQDWATQCGSYATPLVLHMLSVRVERATGERVKLDARSCDSLVQSIDEALSCNDIVQCQKLEEPTAVYLQRCVREDGRVPMDDALHILAARAALGQPIEPLPLADTAIDEPGHLLPLANGRGAVVRVGWQSPSSYAEYLEALKTTEGDDIMVARVFLDDAGRSTLRLGRFTLDEGETLARSFPSLTVRGEDARQEGELLAVVRGQLDKAASASSHQRAAGHLVSALVEASPYIASSEVLRGEFTNLDATLAPVFKWIGQQKGEKLSSIWQRSVLIPAMRRSRALLAADIDEEGSVAIGELTPAAAVELRALMPQSARSYDEGLSYLERALANAKLTDAQEKELNDGVTGQVQQCSQALDKLQKAEETLFVCTFGQGPCDDDVRESTLAELGESQEWLKQARLNAQVAVSMLPATARAATADALRSRCLEN
jgi:hypothetical protein